jgi:hypothetical protein
VLADEIHLLGFLQGRHGLDRFVNQFHAMGEVVPGNAGNANGDIHTGSAQGVERDDLESLDASVGLPHRLDAKEIKNLGHAFAVGPHDIVAHPVDGHILGHAAFLLLMLGNHGLGEFSAHLPGGLIFIGVVSTDGLGDNAADDGGRILFDQPFAADLQVLLGQIGGDIDAAGVLDQGMGAGALVFRGIYFFVQIGMYKGVEIGAPSVFRIDPPDAAGNQTDMAAAPVDQCFGFFSFPNRRPRIRMS